MPTNTRRIIACVLDDEGEQYDITLTPTNWNRKFDEVEQEAKERGIRYATTLYVEYPEGN